MTLLATALCPVLTLPPEYFLMMMMMMPMMMVVVLKMMPTSPPEDPPGVLSGLCGFLVTPNTGLLQPKLT